MAKQQSILGGGVTRIARKRAAPPRVVTPKGGRPGLWPSNPEVAEIYKPGTMMANRDNLGATAPDAGLAEKRANQARFDAKTRQGAVEQGYDE